MDARASSRRRQRRRALGTSRKSSGDPLSWKAKLPAAVAEAPEGCTIIELQKKGQEKQFLEDDDGLNNFLSALLRAG